MLVEYNIYNLFTAITNISKRLMCLQQNGLKLTWIVSCKSYCSPELQSNRLSFLAQIMLVILA